MSVQAVAIRSARAPRSIREIRAREEGTIVKDWGGRYPVALVYPGSYRVGMSNLGLQVIYGLLNRYGGVVAERFFRDIPLSIESERPLSSFPLIAFSFSYELDYLNSPAILREDGIPLFAAGRNEGDPIVIAGGAPIMSNPAPVAPFFDALCIGEAEVILPEVLPILAGDLGREQKLRALADMAGVYVPLYWSGEPVERQYLGDLDLVPAHSLVLTPDTEFGSLYLIEVERGCRFGCRFCMVKHAFSPIRFRSLESLLTQAKEGLGYRRRLGLIGPVVADHPRIEELLARIIDLGAGFSVSSLRTTSVTRNLVDLISRGGARSLALAPEAGTDRLRRVINKGITEDDILRSLDFAVRGGMRQVKLYFMLGLPTETDDDVAGIIELGLKCLRLVEGQGSPCRLAINIAPFVPKAGTPFQWLGMAHQEVLEKRLQMIKRALSGRGVLVKSDSIPWSHVQGILSKGDERLAYAMADMDRVSLSSWEKALATAGIDPSDVLEGWEVGRKLPWRMAAQETEILAGGLRRALGE